MFFPPNVFIKTKFSNAAVKKERHDMKIWGDHDVIYYVEYTSNFH